MDIDIEQSTQFLKLIDPQATSFTFQTFEDSKPATNGNLARVVLRSPAYPELHELHARGAGVYLTVNETDGKGRKIENIRRIRAVWQEDDNDVSHQPLPMPPSMVVETSPKHFHRYWLVEGDWPADEQGRTDFTAVMERMVEDFGSDKNAKDISRVLRVPGFLHRKNGEPHLVHIVEASGKRYTRAQIIAAFPPLEREQKQHYDDEWKSDGNDVERIRDALGHINADDCDTWIRVGMAIKNHLGESGRVLWDEWSSRSSKFHERDQDKTWSSFDRNYSGAPIGIGTLFFLAKRAGWKPKKKAHVGPDDEEKLLNELATLSPIAYARRRKEAAKQLSIPVAVLDKEIDRRRPKEDEQRNFLPHWNVETWSEEVDGDALLDELRRCLKRYIVLPPHADVAVALWVLHTWVLEAFDITPYLVITSPTRRCGKTVLMTLLYWLCRNGKKSDSMSKAAIYRSVDQEKPTLVLDEVGWVLDDRDERQGILCGGFERNGYVEVCEGEGADITPRRFSTYGPKAFGLIGKLTATLMDRSIEVSMKRKSGEQVERLRRRDNDGHAALRQRCLRWAQDNTEALEALPPLRVPGGLNDRAVDAWEPLFAIAALAGGEWPKLAGEAAQALSKSGLPDDEQKGIEVLGDALKVFVERDGEIPTKALIEALCKDEERPWATYNYKSANNKQITDGQLAKLLAPFGIIPKMVGPENSRARGYRWTDFLDAWSRYLAP